MRRKGMNIGLITAVLVMGLALTAQATLIGDSVDFRFMIVNQNFDQSGSTTVTADSSDAVTLTASLISFLIDPFDAGFEITYLPPDFGSGILLGGGSSFEFSSLQWQGQPGQITGLTITNNWDDFVGVTSFTADSATINFGTSMVSANQLLTLTLQTQHSAVPEPSTMLLMGSGLAALMAWRWRQRPTTVQ